MRRPAYDHTDADVALVREREQTGHHPAGHGPQAITPSRIPWIYDAVEGHLQ